MRVIVTGASGFIGGDLLRELSFRQKYEIYGMGRDFSGKTLLNEVSYIKCDLAVGDLPTLLANFSIDCADVLVHAAGQAHIVENRQTHDLFVKNNVIVTKNALLLAQALKVKHFIFLSSAAVYEDSDDYYAATKREAENVMREFCDFHHICYTIIRPTLVYGENDIKGNMFKLIKQMQRGFFPLFHSGKTRKDIIYVRNLSHLIGRVIDTGEQGIIVAKEENVSFSRICSIIKQSMAKPCFLIPAPGWLITPIAFFLGPLHSLGLLRSLNARSIRKLLVNTDFAIAAEHKWLTDEMPFTSAQGLARTAQWVMRL